MKQSRKNSPKFSPAKFHAALSGNYRKFWLIAIVFGLVGSAVYAYTSAASPYAVNISFSTYDGTWPSEILKDPQFASSDTYTSTAGTAQYPIIKMHSETSGLNKNRRAAVTVNCAQDEPVLQWVRPFLSFTGWDLNTAIAAPTLISTGAGSVTGGYAVNGTADTVLNVHIAKKALDPNRDLTCVAQVLIQEKSRGTWRNVAISTTQTLTFPPSVN